MYYLSTFSKTIKFQGKFNKNAVFSPVNEVEWLSEKGLLFLRLGIYEYPSSSNKYVTFIQKIFTQCTFLWRYVSISNLHYVETQLELHQAWVSVKLINIICTAPILLQRSRSTYRPSCRRRLHPWLRVRGTNLTLLINHVCSSEPKAMFVICLMVGCGMNSISEGAWWK